MTEGPSIAWTIIRAGQADRWADMKAIRVLSASSVAVAQDQAAIGRGPPTLRLHFCRQN